MHICTQAECCASHRLTTYHLYVAAFEHALLNKQAVHVVSACSCTVVQQPHDVIMSCVLLNQPMQRMARNVAKLA